MRKLRRRHNQACRDFDNAVRRLHALERVVTVQPYMFKSRPAKLSLNKTSGNIKPVVSQSLRLHSYKGAVRSRRNMKHALGKWTGSSPYQSCGNHLRQGYSNAWTYGCPDKARSITKGLSDGELPVWFSKLCKKYRFLFKGADAKTRSRPSLV